ncbi:hypothetical protein [Micromonospora sp. NPDC003776]
MGDGFFPVQVELDAAGAPVAVRVSVDGGEKQSTTSATARSGAS